MERLTRRVNNTYAVEMPEKNMSELDARKTLMQNFNKCCEKLGKLEDLEEQIGMPLEDFYACITHDEESFFIIEMNDDSEEFEIIEVFKMDEYMNNYSYGKFMFCGHAYNTNEKYYEMSFANYGEEMFLTYEEAEKKLEEMKNENKTT